MTPKEILSTMADLLEPPGRWTQGAEARTEQGHAVAFHDPRAVSYCLFGALQKTGADVTSAHQALSALAFACGEEILPERRLLWLFDRNDGEKATQEGLVAELRAAAGR